MIHIWTGNEEAFKGQSPNPYGLFHNVTTQL